MAKLLLKNVYKKEIAFNIELANEFIDKDLYSYTKTSAALATGDKLAAG